MSGNFASGLSRGRLAADPVVDFDAGPPRVSFEFFPPKTAEMELRLWEVIKRLEPLAPRFVSVTYGAGGSTRERTHATVRRIRDETALEPAAHLTCVAATRAEIDAVAWDYWQAGIRHIVALRGDPRPADRLMRRSRGGIPTPPISSPASKLSPISRSASPPIPKPILRRKAPSATSTTSSARSTPAPPARSPSIFFDVDLFLRFRDRAATAGIAVPIVPGILPVTNFAQVKKFSAACGASIPAWMQRHFDGLDDDPDTLRLVAASIAAEQCRRLHAERVHEFHFYTLNRADLIVAICHLLGVRANKPAAAAV